MKLLFIPRFHRTPGSGDEGGGGLAKSEEVKAIEAIAEQVKSFQTALGDKADADAIKKLQEDLSSLKEGLKTMESAAISKALETINKANEALWKQVAEMQEEAAKSAETAKPNAHAAHKSLVTMKALEDFVSATFEENGKGQKTHNAARIEIKAAETFGIPQTFVGGAAGTDIPAFTGRLVVPGLDQRKRKRNLILDRFNIVPITVPSLIYLIKVEVGDQNPVAGDPGGAAWILSGQAKPKRSFRVTTGKAESKKVAIFGTIEDKLLRDVPSFDNWIREDFTQEMNEAINAGLLNNDPAINPLAPLGLKVNATQYIVTPAFALDVENANYIDAIIAAIASMANRREQADYVAVADDVFYRLHNLKSTDGKWLNNNLIYTDALGRLFIAGVEVVPADIEDVPATHFLMVGRDLGFKIYSYGNMVIERGLNGEDFREDKTSYRAWQEFISYIAENRENSVMYDTFANVLAAITKPVTP